MRPFSRRIGDLVAKSDLRSGMDSIVTFDFDDLLETELAEQARLDRLPTGPQIANLPHNAAEPQRRQASQRIKD